MHRRESIMQAITTLLTGLATTGANVSRFRAHSINALPSISIEQGQDIVQTDISDFNFLTRELDITITLSAQGTGDLSPSLNQISTEVFAAFMADLTLGLGYVIQARLSSDGDIQKNADQDQTIAQIDMVWTITYRHSGTSTEA